MSLAARSLTLLASRLAPCRRTSQRSSTLVRSGGLRRSSDIRPGLQVDSQELIPLSVGDATFGGYLAEVTDEGCGVFALAPYA